MLKTRTITGFLLLLIVGLMILLGGWYFNGLVLLALGICGWEWQQLFKNHHYQSSAIVTIAGIILVVLARNQYIRLSFEESLLLVIIATLLFSMAQYSKGDDKASINFLIMLSGIIYIGFLGAEFIRVRVMDHGDIWIAYLMLNTSIGDTGAYLIGSQWGKHKLGKRISPNKSWEGYLGGAIVAMVFSLGYALVFSDQLGLSVILTTVFGTLLYCVVPVGDFGISMIKRSMGVKHTSNLLPGHGGFLDRMDTHFWAVAIGAIFLHCL